ncbi:DUF1283 family protein [Sodalis ligni]|uniref:DUF1283 family protein n=1 Tax=Sodalis TaxID=84565 RepID=UPI00193FCEE3|nr:DUF1283 family protein [Sodalis ligni]QWA13675.1 DUF1283 family protein [Sodalis ligni]
MKTTSHQRLFRGMLPVALLVFSAATGAASRSQHIIIDSGDNAMTREEARENREQWDATRSLRNKINSRAEKDFDKYDRTADLRDQCVNSDNLNAYWEPNNGRCLDRGTGRPVMMP